MKKSKMDKIYNDQVDLNQSNLIFNNTFCFNKKKFSL